VFNVIVVVEVGGASNAAPTQQARRRRVRMRSEGAHLVHGEIVRDAKCAAGYVQDEVGGHQDIVPA